LRCGQPVVAHGLAHVLRHALTALEAAADVELRSGVALVGRQPEVARCLR
jgi:hypothetical protein